jgi:hypothetical protein
LSVGGLAAWTTVGELMAELNEARHSAPPEPEDLPGKVRHRSELYLCLFCGSDDGGGYTYHELVTCQACLKRVGLKALDGIAGSIGARDRHGRLKPEHVRHQIIVSAVKEYGN